MQIDDGVVDSLVAQLYDPSTGLQALRNIKHRIIGHEDQRAAFVQRGLVPELVRILEVKAEPVEKQYEASAVVGSLVYGGPTYVDALIEAGAVPRLINILNPQHSSPKIVLTTLKTLNLLLDTCTSYTRPPCRFPPPSALIVSEIYKANDPAALESFKWILSQDSAAPIVQQQIGLVSSLISKTCDYIDYINDGEERTQAPSADVRKALLIESGILDILVYRMGSFIVRDMAREDISLDGRPVPVKPSKPAPNGKFSAPNGRGDTFPDILNVDFVSDRPEPAYSTARLAPILEAITAITWESVSRCRAMHRAEWLREVARIPPREKMEPPKPEPHPIITQEQNTFLNSLAFPPLSAGPLPVNRSFANIPSINSSAINTPHRQSPVPRIRQTGRGVATPGSDDMYFRAEEDDDSTAMDDGTLPLESALVPWLTARVRIGDPYSRLLAITMLTCLFRVGMMRKEVVTTVLMPIVIPVLIGLLDAAWDKCHGSKNGEHLDGLNGQLAEHRLILEKAPYILSRLMVENQQLTSAAYCAHVIPKLARILRSTMETPAVKDEGAIICSAAAGMTTANTLQKIHNLKTTEAVLKCFGALTLFKDKYRQAVIAEKVVPCVVAALQPLSNPESIPVPKVSPDSQFANEGNPIGVLIAACSLICSLSRSVSVLRTSLIDAKIHDPLFALLRYPNLEVRIVTTTALCNLVLEFSPMRKALVDAGVVKVLTDHTRSPSPQLRVEAMWALKHLIFTAGSEIKTHVYNELGSNWLLKLITEDDVDEPYRDSDGDEGMQDSYTSHRMKLDGDSQNGGVAVGSRERPLEYTFEELIADGHPYTVDFPTRVPTIRADGTSDAVPINKEKATIQQHSLDFVRNLICGDDAPKMIDKLLTDIGRDKFFEVLSSKIRPRVYAPLTSTGRFRVVYESSGELISSVAYIIAHMAASDKHKQLVVSQTSFMRLFLHLGSLPLQTIRTSFVWALINLTTPDGDGPETLSRLERVQALKGMGYERMLERLAKDSDLDVKERTKTVLEQMGQALRMGGLDEGMKH